MAAVQSVASLANLDLNGKDKENGVANGTMNGTGAGQSELDSVHRTVTGVLTSRPTSRDIKIDSFSMGVNGAELVQDCTIELTIGRRYGLLGQNGCGKTNFLQCLANREVPIPEHMDLYHLCEEAAPTDRTALETVVDYIKDEVARLTVSLLPACLPQYFKLPRAQLHGMIEDTWLLMRKRAAECVVGLCILMLTRLGHHTHKACIECHAQHGMQATSHAGHL